MSDEQKATFKFQIWQILISHGDWALKPLDAASVANQVFKLIDTDAAIH